MGFTGSVVLTGLTGLTGISSSSLTLLYFLIFLESFLPPELEEGATGGSL